MLVGVWSDLGRAEAYVLVAPVAKFLAALDLRSPFSRQWAVGLRARVSALQRGRESEVAATGADEAEM